MTTNDTTLYLTRQEDARQVTKQFVAAVIKANEDRDDKGP